MADPEGGIKMEDKTGVLPGVVASIIKQLAKRAMSGKFGEKNIITNEIKYDYVDLCRQSESQCGKEGKYFEEEPNIELKIMKHRLLSQWSTFYFSIFVGYILVYYLNK